MQPARILQERTMDTHTRYILQAILPLLQLALSCAPSDVLYRALWQAKVHIERELAS